jgi:NTE family protein
LKIALALSGGGHRAAAYHLGVLKYLAEHGLLENVTDISSTSGGSIVIGQIFHSGGSELSWPTSKGFLSHCLPHCKKQITEVSLEKYFIKQMFFPRNWPLFGHRANLMAKTLKNLWSMSASMKQLPTKPNWVINGTANISGDRWYVEHYKQHDRMGCEGLGLADSSNFSIADAIAISAAYPGIIGPYRLQNQQWDMYLSDGGLYDNLSLEAVFDVEQRCLKQSLEADFLIVSDAGMNIRQQRLAPFWRPLLRTLRLIEVINYQVRSLRLRTLLPFIASHKRSACHLEIGTSLDAVKGNTFKGYCFLSDQQVARAKSTPTTLDCLSVSAFDLLVRHGYETALVQLQSLALEQSTEA